jgi:hypothetical protein
MGSNALLARRASPAAFAGRHGTSLIHHQRSPQQILSMASFHGALSGGIVIDFHEPKTTSLSSKAIAHDSHRINRHAILGKEILYIGLICGVREVSHEKFLHFTLLTELETAERHRRVERQDRRADGDST